MITAQRLRAILDDWPDETPVAIRYLEAGEGVQLTADLTSVDQFDEGRGVTSLLLVADVEALP